MSLGRRRFIKTTLASAVTLTTERSKLDSAFANANSGHRLGALGIQVSALHADLNKDFSGTLAQVAALGYQEIELVWWFGNFDHTAKQLRAAAPGSEGQPKQE